MEHPGQSPEDLRELHGLEYHVQVSCGGPIVSLHLVPRGYKAVPPRVMVDVLDGAYEVVPAAHDLLAWHRQPATGDHLGQYPVQPMHQDYGQQLIQ